MQIVIGIDSYEFYNKLYLQSIKGFELYLVICFNTQILIWGKLIWENLDFIHAYNLWKCQLIPLGFQCCYFYSFSFSSVIKERNSLYLISDEKISLVL